MTSPSRPGTPGGPLIELRNLTKTYREGDGERRVLQGLSATVARGEFVTLLGRSGSGKSTLLNLISGIDLPTEGDVVVDGVSLPRLTERERTLFRRDRIGFVFQFYNLIPTLTVEENLLLPLELKGTLNGRGRRATGELLERIGLADRSKSYPDRLSGGEQQRVAIARALVHEPAALLADEPTGNLDAETGQQVLDLMGRLARRVGMTVVMVTHSFEVARLSDRIMTLREGRLVERASPGEPPG